MKKFLLILFLMPLMVSAQSYTNYFKEGTIWHTIVYPDADPTLANYYVDFILENVNGNLMMYEFNVDTPENKSLICQIKTEGDRVLFKTESSEQWYLLYDFGMKSGDGNYFYMPNYPYNTMLPIENYLVCEEISEDVDNPGFFVMTMHEYKDENHDNFTSDYGTGKWIMGIGSELGPMYNMYFNADGMGMTLLSVESNGETVYVSEWGNDSGVESINSDIINNYKSNDTFDVYGRKVNPDNLKKGIYISNGKKFMKKKN